ncbi:hypothetical protein BHE74_00049660 [Ensete ventricosum]|nr:hypothetical protein BHE74_00049660 [Ensete ventricosum]
MVMLLTEEEIGEGQRWLRLWGRGWAAVDLTVGSCGGGDAREGRHEQGTQGCSSNGSKEAAIGKEGEKERWQRRLQQRHGCGEGNVKQGAEGRSYIPVFYIRMEKMKEIKRPPL